MSGKYSNYLFLLTLLHFIGRMFVMIGKSVNVRDRIAERIRRTRRRDVFVRDDFADFGAYDVVGRELRKLVGAGLLVQVGYGLYARAKRSVLSGKPIPSVPLIEIGYQALRRLGHSPKPSPAALDYIEGRTMQVPAGDRIAVSGARVKRRIAFGPRVIEYS
jgi:hypothetical protein